VEIERSNKSSENIVLGCFAKLSKINMKIISLWDKILFRKPNYKLILKSKYFSSNELKNIWLKKFRKETRNRVLLLKASPNRSEHMKLFNLIDLSLDTSPYSGTTITCESLYMGVPVITLNGKKHVERVTGSILTHCGLEEMICNNSEEYISKAISFRKVNHHEIRKKFLDSQDPEKYMKSYEEKIIQLLN